jgi:hypothetical protein
MKKTPISTPDEVAPPQPAIIPPPPGGGRWKWDAARGQWLPKDQPQITQTQE